MFNAKMIYGKVPKAIIESTSEGMEVYNLSLSDAFQGAVLENLHRLDYSGELYKAWYYSDFRRFIPSAYLSEYLDFNRYPLKYDT